MGTRQPERSRHLVDERSGCEGSASNRLVAPRRYSDRALALFGPRTGAIRTAHWRYQLDHEASSTNPIECRRIFLPVDSIQRLSTPHHRAFDALSSWSLFRTRVYL